MELLQLQYFRAVAKTENMSRAAADLFVTQPNLSKSLTRLEAELGVPLFHRRKGKITLNEYGRIFLDRVEQALDALEQGREALLRLQQAGQHRLSLGCMLDDSEWLKAFLTEYHSISLQQHLGTLPELTALLLDRVIDIAFTVLAPQDSRLAFQKLYESEFVIVMSPRHPLARKGILDITDLDRIPFILDHTRVNKQIFGRICKNSGVTLQVEHEVRHADLLYALVNQNLGVSMLPVIHYARTMERFPGLELIYRRVATKGFPRPFWGVAFRKGYQFSPAAAQCREFFRHYMQQEEEVLQGLPGWDGEQAP